MRPKLEEMGRGLTKQTTITKYRRTATRWSSRRCGLIMEIYVERKTKYELGRREKEGKSKSDWHLSRHSQLNASMVCDQMLSAANKENTWSDRSCFPDDNGSISAFLAKNSVGGRKTCLYKFYVLCFYLKNLRVRNWRPNMLMIKLPTMGL